MLKGRKISSLTSYGKPEAHRKGTLKTNQKKSGVRFKLEMKSKGSKGYSEFEEPIREHLQRYLLFCIITLMCAISEFSSG